MVWANMESPSRKQRGGLGWEREREKIGPLRGQMEGGLKVKFRQDSGIGRTLYWPGLSAPHSLTLDDQFPPSLVLLLTQYELSTSQHPHFGPEDRDSMFLQNTRIYLQVHKVLQHSRTTLTSSTPWEPQILLGLKCLRTKCFVKYLDLRERK
jgi:hypothetical protein